MPQIQKGDTFTDGELVSGARLNQLIDSAIIQPQLITGQNQLSTNTLASNDKFIIYDTSASWFRQLNASDILGSGLPITLNTINSTNYSNIVTIPQVGQTSISATFTTANANKTVIVGGAPSHGLEIGDWVWITGVETNYTGKYPIVASTANTFTYNVPVAGTGSSGSLSFLKLGTFRVGSSGAEDYGNLSATGNVYINKILNVTGTSTLNSLTVNGTTTQTGNLNVAGDLNAKTFKVKPSFHYFAQSRTPVIYSISWGGIQNSSNLYGTEIVPMRLQFTPKKAGNKIILQWNISAEVTNGQNAIYVVTRTVVSTGVESPILDLTGQNLSVDSSNNTWSGVAPVGYDTDATTTPTANVIKIVDENSLDVECAYKLRVRYSENATGFFNFNRTGNSSNALSNEIGMSVGHAHEICEI